MSEYSDNLTVADVDAVLRALPDHAITGDEVCPCQNRRHAAQEPEPDGCLHGYCDAENCPACSQEEQEAPPACQQEAVTEIAEAKEILSQIGAYAGGMDYSRIVTAVRHIEAALRALKGGA